MAQKVAIVTGSNKGIGLAIVRGLCKQFDGDVYLTARDEERGKAAVAELENEGLKPLFHKLDINDSDSRKTLTAFIKEKYGGLDILVNNAGIAYKGSSNAPFAEQAEVTMNTNFFDTVALCDGMFPLLRSGARVVHLSSFVALYILDKCSADLATELKNTSSMAELTKYMQKFVDDVKADTHAEEGWASSAYGITKIGVTLMTPIQQSEIEKDTSRNDIIINAADPGHVGTDMSGFKGKLTIDEGADTPLYLALLPPGSDIKGQHVAERTIKIFK